ncbi:unnamed protein product [Rotaria sordida]|uniref:Uncharacterized protein n=1 Tax=Rotaria sordida TaxID=392033 RepID=A0A814JJI9_9BILA|nr:unnamed protein product [Rotaria sordida]
MNVNNSKYDSIRNNSQTKEQLIIKGIQQAWNRQFLSNIHSGVRVKIQQQEKIKNSSFIKPIHKDIHHKSTSSSSSSFKQSNHIQSMLKRLWIESETSALSQNGQKSLEKCQYSSQNQSLTSDQIKSILNNNLLRKNYSLGINSKNKNMNSIGIQTNIIQQIDRQTSCNILKSKKGFNKKSHSTSSSTVSISKTSISDENSTYTNSTSIETSTISTTTTVSTKDNYHYYNQRNKNRNNNAIDTDNEQKFNHIKIKEFQTEKSIKQQPNNEQLLHDININMQYYPQPNSLTVLSTVKKRFFTTFFNLFSYLRLSPFKRDRISISANTIETSKIIHIDRNEENKNIRLPTSRCRRSTARNLNYNSSIEPEKHYLQIKSEEDLSSKFKYLDKKTSNKSIAMRKQYRQVNNSNLSMVDSQKICLHRSKKNFNKINKKKHSYKKENHTNQHYEHKYRHRKKRKHIRTSNRSSQKKILSNSSIDIEVQPLLSNDNHSKVLVEENIKSSICNMECPNNTCLLSYDDVKQTSNIFPNNENNYSQKEILPHQQQDLSLKSINNHSTEIVPCITNNSIFKSNTLPSSFEKILNSNKEYFSHSKDLIRLHVKNKNLILKLSKSKISLSSIDHIDDSIKYHQRNIVNEFKSILQQTKNIHFNNNAFDNDLTINISSPLKIDTEKRLISNKSNIESIFSSIKNRNENKSKSPSTVSSDSQTKSIKDNPMEIHKIIQDQNEIIREGVEQLIRYQKLCQSYKLTSNKAVKQFLMKSTVLSPESLHRLSIINEPNSTYKIKRKTK